VETPGRSEHVVESDQSTADGRSVDVDEKVQGFLQALLELTPGADEMRIRQFITGFLGVAELRPDFWVEDNDAGYASLTIVPDIGALVNVRAGGLEFEYRASPVELRACLLAANATATAVRFFQQVVDDVVAELDHQRSQLLAGLEPVHPAQREAAPADPEFPAGEQAHEESFKRGYAAALEAVRGGREDCPHAGMPPATGVEPFGFRSCPDCGTRMRAYPASTSETGLPEWREAL
jgi:hypothetical protein